MSLLLIQSQPIAGNIHEHCMHRGGVPRRPAPPTHLLSHSWPTSHHQAQLPQQDPPPVGQQAHSSSTHTVDVQTIGDIPATQTAGVLEVGVCKERTYTRTCTFCVDTAAANNAAQRVGEMHVGMITATPHMHRTLLLSSNRQLKQMYCE